MEEKKLTDEELKKAFFILRHGSDEGLSEYVKSVLAIENEYNRQKAEIERLTEERENMQAEIMRFEDMKFTQNHCDLYAENEWLKASIRQSLHSTAQNALEEFICQLVNLRLVSTKSDLYVEMLEVKDDLLKEKYGVE